MKNAAYGKAYIIEATVSENILAIKIKRDSFDKTVRINLFLIFKLKAIPSRKHRNM